jgi:AraC-like DNA-binding protein
MPWHSHNEFELVYIISGSGKKFAGESMVSFSDHDLTFIGPNTPHFFLADDRYYDDNDAFCHWWVVQFSKDIFPSVMDNLEAFGPISRILWLSQYGIHFSADETRKRVFKTIKSMNETDGLNRIITLYHLLNFIGRDQSIEILCKEKPELHPGTNNDIINRVYSYLLKNFKKNILLEDLAQLTHMRITTLCTYYKRHTLKSIIESLNEIRISHACKLLVNSRLDINQIAYESGFRNISNFNRHFLKNMKVTPKNYRNSFNEKNR